MISRYKRTYLKMERGRTLAARIMIPYSSSKQANGRGATRPAPEMHHQPFYLFLFIFYFSLHHFRRAMHAHLAHTLLPIDA